MNVENVSEEACESVEPFGLVVEETLVVCCWNFFFQRKKTCEYLYFSPKYTKSGSYLQMRDRTLHPIPIVELRTPLQPTLRQGQTGSTHRQRRSPSLGTPPTTCPPDRIPRMT